MFEMNKVADEQRLIFWSRMMEVEVGRHNVLLVRCDGVYSAISNQCTHYGAPLSKGNTSWTDNTELIS